MFGKDKAQLNQELAVMRDRIRDLEKQVSHLLDDEADRKDKDDPRQSVEIVENPAMITTYSHTPYSTVGYTVSFTPVNEVVELILTHLGLSIDHQPEKTVLVKSKLKSTK